MGRARFLLQAMRRLVRTHAFRLAGLYFLVFALSVIGILFFVYWTSADFVERQTEATLGAEVTGLSEQYTQRGLSGLVQIVVGQPDIFTSTMDAGGRAGARDANTQAPEPFVVTQRIELVVTGVRFAAPAEITITVGTTPVPTASVISVQPNRNMAGFDSIIFDLPSSLAGAGDVPIQVQFQRGIITVSRPADTAPHITIN